ncbi:MULTISPECIES: DNA polymerase III subunit psi [Lonsdalea]|uniref:DNA polymerase III subunit psi n=2 Tax=Lonsdalea TaxID=1082702 RepID=A0ACD1JDS1_9GAMM|nr:MULTISPECIES: DNA polymerase III subunit psi [Lonsdalea]OSM99361.1 DNA polymerase III subunit psi [Lonsdalea populi]QPQ23674.1 DNA polymerase III subunit psi [Lonsdalea populi]RAT12884.1 DNA polymerase III subunit psi [Lonsdalea quercina]RAT16817.1 DNA polymerase III subunit psi [Lonsdalea quercina]RAT20331.1 DNA polymerase III subunit psi [Lonsdalea populi]
MTSHRDRLLQQLGITQWTLRRPAALQGEIAISLPSTARLLLVADPLPAIDDPLLQDVLRSLQLTPEQIYSLLPQQVEMLPDTCDCPAWWLGATPMQPPQGVQLTSPALSELDHNPDAKRALWRQICQYEHDLYPDLRRSDDSLSD